MVLSLKTDVIFGILPLQNVLTYNSRILKNVFNGGHINANIKVNIKNGSS